MTSALSAMCLLSTADSTHGHYVQDPSKSIPLDHRPVGGRYTTKFLVDHDIPNYIEEIRLALRDNDYDSTLPVFNVRC